MLESDISHRTRTLAAPRTMSAASERMLYRAFLVMGDALALLVAFALAYWLRFYVEITVSPGITPTPSVYFPLILALIPTWLLLFYVHRLYDIHVLLGGLTEYSRVFTACTYGMMLVIVFSFLVRQFDISRAWLLMAWLLAGVIVCSGRFVARRIAYSQRKRGRFLTRALIVGTNAEAHALATQLRDSAGSGLLLTGFITTESGNGSAGRAPAGLPSVGSLYTIGRAIQEQEIDEIIVATSALSDEDLVALTGLVTEYPAVQLTLSSGLYEVLTTGMHTSTRASVPLMTVNKLRLTRAESLFKTALDYGVILLALPLLLPVFVVLALIVRFDSPGPIFYSRRVVGAGGREFNAFKFRTMLQEGDKLLEGRPDLQAELAENHKLKEDPRITRAGHWMRRLSLDELPQLINVLLGQMSLVGPRMIHPSEAQKYGRLKTNLFTVKPGLTGMWQVSGRSDLTYEDRVQLDMVYIRNYSVWLDLQILFIQTIPAVLKGSGAY